MDLLRILEILWLLFFIRDEHLQEEPPADSFKVEQVQTVFRHGARTPSAAEALVFNVTDPDGYDPHDFGQLTDKGKKQNYKLGRLLSKIYKHLIPRTFKRDQVHTYCSSVNRTVESMNYAIAGLYSETKRSKVFRSFQCKESDVLFHAFNDPEVQKLFSEAQNSPKYERKVGEYDDFYEYMESHTKLNFTKVKGLKTIWIYTALNVQKELKKPLPHWATDDVMDQSTELYTILLDALSSTQQLRRMNGGPMIRSILENMKDKRADKIYLYSGHDTNVAALARIFEIEALRLPEYSSAVILERLRGPDRKKYVRVLYWTGQNEDLGVARIRGCDEFCPIEKFVEIFEYAIPSDEELENIDYDLKHHSLKLIT